MVSITFYSINLGFFFAFYLFLRFRTLYKTMSVGSFLLILLKFFEVLKYSNIEILLKQELNSSLSLENEPSRQHTDGLIKLLFYIITIHFIVQ